MPLTNADLPAALRKRSATTVTQSVPVVTETVTVTSERRNYLLADPAQWSWSQLRDYVIAEIEARFGPQPRHPGKETGIFQRFAANPKDGGWGSKAGPIAKCAFEEYDGWWRDAPISITRFTKGNDPYFAQVIASRLFPAG